MSSGVEPLLSGAPVEQLHRDRPAVPPGDSKGAKSRIVARRAPRRRSHRHVAPKQRDIGHHYATPRPGGGDLPALATSVFTDFSFPFEVASVLLLAAMVGAIVLTKRDEAREFEARRP